MQAPSSTLEGSWELAAIGERLVDRSNPLSLDIGPERMTGRSDCVRMAWRYFNRGAEYVVQREPVESCARGLDEVEEEFRARVDNARLFRRRPDGVLLIDTALGGLTLRPALTEPDPPAPGALSMDDLAAFAGVWRVAEINGLDLTLPETFAVSVLPREVHAVSGCVRWSWRLEPDRNRQATLRRAPSAEPPCARPLRAEERHFEQLAHGGHLRAGTPDGSLVLWSDAGSAVLRRDDKGGAGR